MSKKDGTKLCKHCKMEIPTGAKVCPHCRKKQGGKLKWVAVGILIIVAIGAVSGGSDKETPSSNTNVTKENAPTPTPIEYITCTVNDMMQELSDNAMGASDKYKDNYLEITGRLAVIDSDGKYISLYPDDQFALTGVQCYIKNDEQKSAVAKMKKDDIITLRGKCKNVGEVIGYTLDIDSID